VVVEARLRHLADIEMPAHVDCAHPRYAGDADKPTLDTRGVDSVDRMKTFLSPLALCLSLVACGGNIEPVPTAQPATDTAGQPAKPPTDEASTIAPPPLRECAPVPEPVRGIDSCNVARDHLYIDAMSLVWSDPSRAWKAGATAQMTLRYQNTASNSDLHYPGVTVVISDERVRPFSYGEDRTSTVTTDFYMIPECAAQEAGDHELRVSEDIPSGTRITLSFEPSVASRTDGSCEGMLQSTQLVLVVP
jgi:hypothetical protein